MNPKSPGRAWVFACALVLIVGLAGLWWLCARNPRIAFLSPHGTAEWVVYPWPFDSRAQHQVELNTVFRKTFTLAQPPGNAVLHVRSLRRMTVEINHAVVDTSGIPTNNWKDAAEITAGDLLHGGTNEIAVTVFNADGPPALWLSLNGGGFKLDTGADWEASLEGAVWRPVRLADEPLELEKGNPLEGGEGTLASIRNQWPTLLVFLGLSAGVFAGRKRLLKMLTGGSLPEGSNARADWPATILFYVIAIFWIALFINNRSTLPKSLGFDVTGHLAYVEYIRAHHALPLATDGWEMCQPPLYYMVSAATLWLLQLGTFTHGGIETLRFLGLLTGLINIQLILLCLRMLFPRDSGKQIFGIILAGCVPVQFYMAQYVTNEFMMAAWVTGAIYFCLRIITEDKDSWRLALGAGLCLGAALLTKVTALVAIPFIAGALIWWLAWKRRFEWRAWGRTLGVFIASASIVCGWHYFRVWRHFGTPLVHDWDPASGFAWWAANGFQTTPYFCRFGECLAHPFHSELRSFGDGLYSTLWGDGLYGSCMPLVQRPPWNYELMASGYLLALLPTAIVLLGAAASLVKLIRRPDPPLFLLVGLPCATLAALVYLDLKLPFYCCVKAFYGLMALLPVCCLGGEGWEILTRRLRFAAPVLYIVLGVWAVNAGASFWIRGGTAAAHTSQGLHFSTEGAPAAAVSQFAGALQIDPQYLDARRALAAELLRQNHVDEAETNILQSLEFHPDDAQCLLQLGAVLAARGQLDEAVNRGRKAVALAPDSGEAHKRLTGWLYQMKRYPDVVAAGREALRVLPLDAEIHFETGSSFAAMSNHVEAAKYLRYACDVSTNLAIAHDALGSSLVALGREDAAIKEIIEATRLATGEVSFRLHLASAFEQTGRSADAIKAYREALQLSPQGGPALSGLGWLLATCPEAEYRNGAEAVTLAESALRTGQTNAVNLTVLAAAYAEAGRYEDAVTAANKAIVSAEAAGESKLASANREFLKLYLDRKPCHQSMLRSGPAVWTHSP